MLISKNNIIIIALILLTLTPNLQGIEPDKKMYLKSEVKILNIKEKVKIDKDLSIMLDYFSHKRPYRGGPTKATAYILIYSGNKTDEISLSVHGIQGKTSKNDGLSESERFDTIVWKGYKFQLKKFDYGRSIGVIISKK